MKLPFLAFSIALSCTVMAQEICNNGIDDDSDGLIDLNDDECDCGQVISSENLIYNGSFEITDCCPAEEDELPCATGWQELNAATPDLYNLCDLVTLGFGLPEPSYPLPGGGSGWIGLAMNGGGAYGWEEFVGGALDEPLMAGTEYTFRFHANWCADLTEVNLEFWGSPEADDYTWPSSTCPHAWEEFGEWEVITGETINFTDAEWHEYTWTFTPDFDIYAYAFGYACETPSVWDLSYNYFDELHLSASGGNDLITETGDWCTGDLNLSADIDTIGGDWQWYLNGVALVEETSAAINPIMHGPGEYIVVYTVGDTCIASGYETQISGEVSAEFSVENGCSGETIAFENTSTIDGGITPEWLWNFGDDLTASSENPSKIYETPGTYSVQLVVSGEGACNDTSEIDIIVHPTPDVQFEFIANEISSEEDGLGGCVYEVVEFNDLTTISAPGVLDEWNWNFGDDGTTGLENPEHLYTSAGTYTVTLEVVSEDGCSNEHELEIIMGDTLNSEIEATTLSCFGFNDGTIVVEAVDGTGEVIYEITDEGGTLLNEDNSNEITDLAGGWYYILVRDDISCDGFDSIFVEEPFEMGMVFTTTDEMLGDDGIIDITVSGGTPEYEYDWDNDGTGDFDDPEDLTMVAGGTYTVVVRDENNCDLIKTIILDTQLSIGEHEDKTIEIYPNPTSHDITIAFEGAFEYQLKTIDGKLLTQGTAVDQALVSVENYSDGIYFVHVIINDNRSIIKLMKN